jgi:hypothetical protein
LCLLLWGSDYVMARCKSSKTATKFMWYYITAVKLFCSKSAPIAANTMGRKPEIMQIGFRSGRMMTRYVCFFAALLLVLTLSGAKATFAMDNSSAVTEVFKDDVRPPPPGLDPTEPDPNLPTDNETPPADELSVGEVPEVKMVDLTPDMARRAVDAYVLLKDKYKDAQLENFDTLQEFVDKDPMGKAFEADVKTAGFANVDDWNQAVTTVGAAYSNIIDDQSEDIKSQIDEVQKDPDMAQDMKDRIIASLNALIPTENNRKVVQQMIDDINYAEKLKLLETEEE